MNLRIEYVIGTRVSQQGIHTFPAVQPGRHFHPRLYAAPGLACHLQRIVDFMAQRWCRIRNRDARAILCCLPLPAIGDMHTHASLNGARVLFLTNDATMRQRMQQASSSWGCQLTEADTTQDALTRLRTALARGGTWTYDLLLVDMNSVRSTAIALHRNLRRTPDLEGLRVVYLTGNDPLPDELNDGLMLSLQRTIHANEMRSAISSFLSTPIVRAETAQEKVSQGSSLAGHEHVGSSTSSETQVPAIKKLRGHLLLVEDKPAI